MSHMDSGEFEAHAEQIERMVQCVNDLRDADARSTALELMQSLMDLHGAGLSRVVELLSEAGEAGRSSLAKLGGDPLLCGLLVLYGLHPATLEERVGSAIRKAGDQLRKQGGSVELIGIADAVVNVKIKGVGHGCGSSPDAFKSIVEQAILEAAPEVREVAVEGTPSSGDGFVPLNMIQPATKEGSKYEESAV